MLTTLLTKDYKLTFNQNKWFKSLSEANIKIVDQIYTLQVTTASPLLLRYPCLLLVVVIASLAQLQLLITTKGWQAEKEN